MATKKVTITLDEDDLADIRRLVAAGTADSVAGFVQHAVGLALEDVDGWRFELATALDSTGGPITDDERAWADSILRRDGSRRAKAS